MRKFVIMGAQGSGKGTQAALLAERFDLVHISVGDIFRWHIQHHTKLGARVLRTIAAGHLVADEIVDEIVRDRLAQHDWNYGFILDGFPRNREQAEFFLESYDVDAVIAVDVPDEVVLQRVLARRLCAKCGLDFNLIHHRPKAAGVCDVCGGTLVPRADDNEAAVRARLADYHIKTQPVIDLFRRKGLIVVADGTRSPDEVHLDIVSRLGLARSSAPAIGVTG